MSDCQRTAAAESSAKTLGKVKLSIDVFDFNSKITSAWILDAVKGITPVLGTELRTVAEKGLVLHGKLHPKVSDLFQDG
jgi:hypothetical protein